MNQECWIVGEAFDHPQYGQGTIVFIGKDYLGLALDNGQQVLVRQTHFQETSIAPPNLCESDETPTMPWPDSTFAHDDEEAQALHSMGSHWQAFADEPTDILQRLPEFLQEARLQERFLANYKPHHTAPADWSQGFYMAWPHVNHGLSMVVEIGGENSFLASVFPFIHAAKQHQITLRQVHVWKDGMEAQITAAWGNSSISFYDTQFLLNRDSYETDLPYEFLLMGLAYQASPARHIELPFEYHPDQVAWFNMNLTPGEEPMSAKTTIKFDDMAMFIPIAQWDRDDFQFRGPVQSVSHFTDWLGQDGWRAEVIVVREAADDGGDLVLTIYITRRAWKGTEPPSVGMNIEGTLWLQGTMVLPYWVRLKQSH